MELLLLCIAIAFAVAGILVAGTIFVFWIIYILEKKKGGFYGQN